MALAENEPVMENKAYVMRESEHYRIPEAVWREHLGQGGNKEVFYEVKVGGMVKMKAFKVFVDPDTSFVCGAVRYILAVDTVDNVEVKGWVHLRKSCEMSREAILRGSYVRLSVAGVPIVSLWNSLEEESYNHTSFIKQHLEDGHIVVVIDIEISVKKEKFKRVIREVKLLKDMKTIFQRETGQTDFTLICGDHRLPCHKALLQARSPVFKTGIEFNEDQGVPEACAQFEIKDSNPLAVAFMLDHIYGEGLISKEDNMYLVKVKEDIPDPEDLLHLANYLNLPELVEICKEGVISMMTPENAVKTLVIISRDMSGDKEVKDKVISFIKKHAKAVIKSEGWGFFVKNYGDLVTDVVSALVTSE